MTEEAPKTITPDFDFGSYTAWEVIMFERATGVAISSMGGEKDMPMAVVIGAAWIAETRGGPVIKPADVPAAFEEFARSVTLDDVMAGADDENPTTPEAPPETSSAASPKTSRPSARTSAKPRKPSAK